jgi:hypothetical protein
MAFSLTSEYELRVRERDMAGSLDPLILAYAVLFAFLILAGLLITLFGEPLDNNSAVHFDLAESRAVGRESNPA